MKSSGHPSFFKLCVLALMLVSYTDSYVVAAPRGPRVVSGTATFQQEGNTTVITSSNRSVINYQGFDIAPNETVRFVQPSATATVLNRVISANPTNIFGQLQSNGIIYIVNPYGVYFQNGSVLNVGGLVAAAGRITDSDFTSGRIHFTDLAGDVRNDGVLAADNRIALMGANVVNNGTMTVARGVALMTSGSDIYVGEKGGNVFVQANGAAVASAPTGSVTNRGTVAAPRVVLGAGDMYSTAIVNTGLLQGSSVSVNAGRNGTATVSGRLDASAPTATKKNGGKGGDIQVTGGTVALQSATLDASGVNGGGSVRVGGDFHGGGTLGHATTTSVDGATTIKADATGAAGDGGTVVLWSDSATSFAGQISARGGSTSGNGGSAEVSSKQNLSYGGFSDLRAGGSGQTGSLLLDPQFITITALGMGTIPASGTVAFGDMPVNDTISPVALVTALSGGNVTLQATSDIRFSSSVAVLTGTSNLTLQAGRSILFDPAVTLTLQGALTATFNDAASGGTPTPGAGAFTMGVGSAITAPGGVTITGGSLAGNTAGAVILQNIGTGSITAGTASGAINVTNTALGGGAITASQPLLTLPIAANTNGGAVTLNATGAIITTGINASPAGTGTGAAISLTSPAGSALNGYVAGQSLTTTGPATLNFSSVGSGSVTTVGSQTYGGAVTLGANNIVLNDNAAAGNIAFNSTVNGSFTLNLTASGNIVFTGAVGGMAALNSLTIVNGTTSINGGAVTTTGAQTYGDNVRLGNATVLTGGSLNLTSGKTFDGAGGTGTGANGAAINNLTLAFPGAVIPVTGGVTNNGTVAPVSAGTFNNINNFVAVGTTGVNFLGNFTTVGAQTYNGAATVGNTTILASTGNGNVAFANTLDSASNGTFALTVNTGGQTIFSGAVGGGKALLSLTTDHAGTAGEATRINGGGVTTTTFQTYNDAVTLGADTTLTAGADVRFNNTLDSDAAATLRNLKVNTPADEYFEGLVGSVAPLLSLTTDGGGTASGTAHFDMTITPPPAGGVAAGVSVGAGGIAINDSTLFNVKGSNDNTTPAVLVFGNGTQGYSLGSATNTPAANALLQTTVAQNTVLVGTDAATIPTTPNYTNGGAVNFGALYSLQPAVGPVAGTGTQNLTIYTGAGFGGNYGSLSVGEYDADDAAVTFYSNVSALNILRIVANPGMGSGGPPYFYHIDNDVTTTGAQNYPDLTYLSTNVTLTSTGGGNITFLGRLNSLTSLTPYSLIINTTGNEVFNGQVGGINPLRSLTTDNPAGGIQGGFTIFNYAGTSGSPSVKTVNDGSIIPGLPAAGTQEFFDPVRLNANTALTSTPLALGVGGNLIFHSTVDGAFSLTLNTTADEYFYGLVGSATKLTSLTVDDFNNPSNTSLANIGTTHFLMNPTAAGAPANAAGVDVTGAVMIGDKVEFGVTGSTVAAATHPSVRTGGAQSYFSPATLLQDTMLQSLNTAGDQGGITFGSTVDGTFNLSVNSPGNEVFKGLVGNTAPLRSLVTDAVGTVGGNTVFSAIAPATSTSVTTVNNGTALGGIQTYNDAVLLNVDTTLTSNFGNGQTVGGNITFNSTVDTASTSLTLRGLTVNTGALTIFNPNALVGSISPLASLTTDAGGQTQFLMTIPVPTGVAPIAGVRVAGNVFIGDDVLFNTSGSVYQINPTVLTYNNGTQTYNGTTTLATNTVLIGVNPVTAPTTLGYTGNSAKTGNIANTGGGAILFGAPVTSSTASDLTIFTGVGTTVFQNGVTVGAVDLQGANVTFQNTVGGLRLLSVGRNDETPGVIDLNGGLVQTNLGLPPMTGDQYYRDAVLLSANTQLTDTVGSNVYFASTLDGTFKLFIDTTGDEYFQGLVGSGSPLASLTIDGSGDPATNLGTARFNMDLTGLTPGIAGVRVGAGGIVINDTTAFSVMSSTHDNPTVLVLGTGTQNYNGATTVFKDTTLVGTDSTSLVPTTTYVGGGKIFFGRTLTGVAMPTVPSLQIYTSLGTATFLDAVNTISLTAQGANVTFSKQVNGLNLLGIYVNGTVTGPLGVIDLNGGSVTTRDSQFYNADVVLSTDNVLTNTTVGNITFAARIDSDAALTPRSLSVSSPGNEQFQGNIGSVQPLRTLATDDNALYRGGQTIFGPKLDTTTPLTVTTTNNGAANAGTQDYYDAVQLNQAVTLTSQFRDTGTRGGSVTFHNTVDGAFDLLINTTGDEYFEGLVGSATPLANLTTDNDPTFLGGTAHFDMTTTGTAAAGVSVTGNVTIGDSTSFFVKGATLNLPSILTGGAQTYGTSGTPGAALLSQNTFLQSTGGKDISFVSTVDGAFDLTLNTAGNENFLSLVGSSAPLTNLTVDNRYNPTGSSTVAATLGTTTFAMNQPPTATAGVRVTGAVTINDQVRFVSAGSSVADTSHATIQTGGAQTYNGAAALSNATSLVSTGTGNVTFATTVDSTAGSTNALAVFTGGQTIFNGFVGGANPLLSLMTDGPGITQINGGGVTTTGFQTYGDAVTLGADTVLTSLHTAPDTGDITFARTVDGTVNLTVNTPTNEFFEGLVGNTARLASLTTNGGTAHFDMPIGGAMAGVNVAGGVTINSAMVFNAGGAKVNHPTVLTGGAQIYHGAVSLTVDTFLISSGSGDITFNDTVDGTFSLTLNTTGTMTLNKAVGGGTALANFTAGTGPISLNGGFVTTTGAQTYNGAATLGVDTQLTSTATGDIHFASTLDGKFRLTVNTAGQTIFDAPVGGGTALLSLTTDAGGTTRINGGSVTTTDFQSYGDALTAASPGTTFLTDTAGNVLLLGPVTVASSLLQVNARRIFANNITAAAGGTHNLDLEATNLLVLAGSTYDLGAGTIRLNTDTTTSKQPGDGWRPGDATIVTTSDGNPSFSAADFEMGYLQTLLALGSVQINANTATLSNIEARINLTVHAPTITLLPEPEIATINGQPSHLLFVAGMAIDFGNGLIQFASPLRSNDTLTANFFTASGDVTLQRTSGLTIFLNSNVVSLFNNLDALKLTQPYGSVPDSKTLSSLPSLNLASPNGQGGFTGNSSQDVTSALAGALPLLNRDLDLPSDGLAVTAAQLEQLKKLGINPRLAERNERSSIRDKRALFAQLVNAGDTENYGRLQPIAGAVSRLVPSDFVVVVDRMSAVEVQSILQAFEQVYGKDQGKVPDISSKLQAAYVDYATANPSGTGNGHAFASYVKKNHAKYSVLDGTIRDFDNLFGRLEGLGLTDAEVAKSEEHIVHTVQLTGLDDSETRKFINDLRKDLPADQRNTPPASAPAASPAPETKKPTPPPPRTARGQKPDFSRQAGRVPAPTPAPADATHTVAGL